MNLFIYGFFCGIIAHANKDEIFEVAKNSIVPAQIHSARAIIKLYKTLR